LFLLFAAPIARRIAIERANTDDRIGNTHISVADLKMWLFWLDTMDPLCARMIDLHYFAGLSFKETAEVLDLPPQAIIRDLRFAKAWLMLRLEPNE
jgi:DNA-directed RNA polymerase specialized sigma24 family protein